MSAPRTPVVADPVVVAARPTAAAPVAAAGRPMIRAHVAYVRLDADLAVAELDAIVSALQKSPAREGYGQWLLGMIAYQLGDHRKAAVHLRAWLRRHAARDEAKTLTLREELRRARLALARIESD